MFQNYMRSRLGMGGSIQPMNPIGVTAPVDSVPPGFNPQPFHPQMNQNGWPGHPLNSGATLPMENQFSPSNHIIGGANTVAPAALGNNNTGNSNPTINRSNPYNPYSF